jgi:hypothetical protein
MVGMPGLASAASINVAPSTVVPGDDVRLTGDVLAGGTPGCDVSAGVTLVSDAFAGLGEFAGVAAVNLPLDASGHFDSTVTLSTSLTPGTYSIGGRCGGNLGVSATLVVGALPPTGLGSAVRPCLAAASTLLVLGLAALASARRPRVRGA